MTSQSQPPLFSGVCHSANNGYIESFWTRKKNNPVVSRCKTGESIYISAKPLQEKQKER